MPRQLLARTLTPAALSALLLLPVVAGASPAWSQSTQTAGNSETMAESPVAVSPGDASRLALIGDSCPTFSWGSVEGAHSYELVVYRLGEESEEAPPVLRKAFAGSVSGWTPSLDRCLERGGRYAWGVRAVGEEKASEWSQPNLFQVAPGPSAVEFEEALEVVRTYLGARGEAVPEAATEEAAESPGESDRASAEAPTPLAPAGTQLSVDGNVDAVSFSGNGAMLTSLDPANLSAGIAGIDISGNAVTATEATSATTASDLLCTDCIGTTEIDRTNFDADLLDGLDSTVFASTSHNHFGEMWSGNTENGLQIDYFTSEGGKFALWGRMTSATGGLLSAAVRAENLSLVEGLGVWGSHAGSGIGVLGTSQTGVGLFGQSASSSGYAGFFDGKTYVASQLGIGNTSPVWPLSILASQAVAQLDTSVSLFGSVLELKSSVLNATLLGAINFNDGFDTFPGQIAYRGDDTMTFMTNEVERMRVTDSGRLGINTIDPQAELHVNGRARFESEVGIVGAVGIGTLSPSAMLDVNGSIAIAPTQRWLSIAATSFDYNIGAISDIHSIQRHSAYFGLRDYGISNNLQILNGPAYAAVSLPDGATIRELKSKGTLEFRRVRIDTDEVELIAQLTAGGTGTTTAVATGTEVVDNSTYAYVLSATAFATGGPGGVGAVRIRYEITSPLP